MFNVIHVTININKSYVETVICLGDINESYPAQVGTTKIEIVSEK